MKYPIQYKLFEINKFIFIVSIIIAFVALWYRDCDGCLAILRYYCEQDRDNDNSIQERKKTFQLSDIESFRCRPSTLDTLRRHVYEILTNDASLLLLLAEILLKQPCIDPDWQCCCAASTIFQNERTILKPVLTSKSLPIFLRFTIDFYLVLRSVLINIRY